MTAKLTENESFAGDERELLKCIANGDRNAFKLVYTRYLHDLHRYVYLFTKSKERTEEIVQAVFVKVWERREMLVNVSDFKGYVYRCARNLLLDEIRREQVKQKVMDALTQSTDASCEYSDARLNYNQYYKILQKAIRLLPEKRKQIVELRVRDELSLDEIAAKLSISKSVVKKQLYAGLAFVREYFQNNAELIPVLFLLFPCLF